LAAKGLQREIEPHCFHEFRGDKRFRPGFYVFGFEEVVKVKRLKTEVPEHRHGGVSGLLDAARREMFAASREAACLRKVFQ